MALKCGAEQLSAAPSSELADEALAEWVKFFAGGIASSVTKRVLLEQVDRGPR